MYTEPGLGLAKPAHLPEVRRFASNVESFLDALDAELVLTGRGHSHSLGHFRFDGDTASVEVPRTRRSRVTHCTARVRISPTEAISGECDGAACESACEHVAAALFGLVARIEGDDRILMRLKGMSDDEIQTVLDSRKPGRTRWAATAYDDGPTAAEAFARTPGPLPALPSAPDAPTLPSYRSGHCSGRFHCDFTFEQLELQAALAAKTAFAALTATCHPAARDRAPIPAPRGPAERGLPELAEQWQPDPEVCDAADERFAAAFGKTSRRLNRWTIPSLELQLRLARDGRWHPYTKAGNRWVPAAPPASDLEGAVALAAA